jgi:hypothetical protein
LQLPDARAAQHTKLWSETKKTNWNNFAFFIYVLSDLLNGKYKLSLKLSLLTGREGP